MKITFLGATKEVTGSNYLVEAAGKKFLVDCGLHQGSVKEELLNEKPFAFDVKSIDFILAQGRLSASFTQRLDLLKPKRDS